MDTSQTWPLTLWQLSKTIRAALLYKIIQLTSGRARIWTWICKTLVHNYRETGGWKAFQEKEQEEQKQEGLRGWISVFWRWKRDERGIALPSSCLEKPVRFTKTTSSEVSLYEWWEKGLRVIKNHLPQGPLEGQRVSFSLKQGSLDSLWIIAMP